LQERSKRRGLLENLDPGEIAALTEAAYDWRHLGRAKQLEPAGDWIVWLLLAGRGFGKTRTGAEWIRQRVCSGQAREIVLGAPTAADLRDIVVEGPSGILNVFPPHQRPRYEPSKRRITFHTRAQATLIAGETPERFRGPQCDTIWADELASWRYRDSWDNLMFGFRVGDPRALVTTTPKPTKLIRELVADDSTHLTRGSSYENRRNLAEAYFRKIIRPYEGTRKGRQEIDAELLDSLPGALLTMEIIDALRVKAAPELGRIVVAIDPAASSEEDSNETGIVAAGLGAEPDASGEDHGYLLEDGSCRGTPGVWAKEAVRLYDKWGADLIVAERNNGGEMVESVIRNERRNITVKLVWASRGKHVRAEPVTQLHEKGRIHHVGAFAECEDQLCAFTDKSYEGGDSPDRADAAIWAFTELMVDEGPEVWVA
jgi:phage terminase large subunit-like protein